MARSIAQVELSVRKTLAELAHHIPVSRAFLFGSYVTGTPHENSDIDLAVFSRAVDRMSIEEKVDLIARVGLVVPEPVEIHLLPERMLSEATPADFVGYVSTQGREVEIPKVSTTSRPGQ